MWPLTAKEINQEIQGSAVCDKGLISDGFHTFNELYEMQLALTVALFKQLHKLNSIKERTWRGLWKSKLHFDSTMFEGFFIVGMSDEPKTIGIGVKASFITFHYPLPAWDLFDMCDELPNAPEWDGHTEKDVLERLKYL